MTENQEKFEASFKKLKKANVSLTEALERESDDLLVRDGIIQRFEFTIELAWKTLQSYLRQRDLIIKLPRDVLDQAFENGLIESVKEWGDLLTARNQSSHVYDEETSDDIYKTMKARKYLIDRLIEVLSGKLSKS